LEFRSGLDASNVHIGIANDAEHRIWIHEANGNGIALFAKHHVAREQCTEIVVDLNSHVRERWVARAEDDVGRAINTDLGLQRRRHIDPREHSESFNGERRGDGLLCLFHRSVEDGSKGVFHGHAPVGCGPLRLSAPGVQSERRAARPVCEERYGSRVRHILTTLLFVAVVASTFGAVPADATGGEGEAWPSFTESTACGAQRAPTPHAAATGWLSRDTLLRGEFAAMFGRSVEQVQAELVRWTLPGSSVRLAVHPRMAHALTLATENVNKSLDEGMTYRIDGRSTFSAASRTISGILRISRHTYGTAFDINASRNPIRKDNELISDLPDWWVQAFRDAGFCWGGQWIGSKDAMHFAWQGPAFSGMTELPLPFEPLTTRVPFTNPAASIRVIPRERPETIATALSDSDGNGALDVIRVVDHGPDLVLDVSYASRSHNACSENRMVVADIGAVARGARALGFGDMDGRGGQDLWIATDKDGLLRFTVRWAYGGFSAETAVTTAIPTPSPSAWISTADYDADGKLDVIIVDRGAIEVWSINPATGVTSELLRAVNPMSGADDYFLGDLDLDNRPDLFAVNSGEVSSTLAKDGYQNVSMRTHSLALPGGLKDIRAADYDGDGHIDLVTFDGISKQVWLGNTRLEDGLPLEVWFEHEDPECGEDEPTWDHQTLTFTSSSWIAEGAFAWRSRNGLAVGCDPERDGCDAGPVTGQMFTEFMAWVEGLDATSGSNQAAAWAVSASGYKVPCAVNDSTCWHESMPRAEISSLFGQFLTTRHGDVPLPHRWTETRIDRDEPWDRPR